MKISKTGKITSIPLKELKFRTDDKAQAHEKIRFLFRI